jgi:hypothetical protein
MFQSKVLLSNRLRSQVNMVLTNKLLPRPGHCFLIQRTMAKVTLPIRSRIILEADCWIMFDFSNAQNTGAMSMFFYFMLLPSFINCSCLTVVSSSTSSFSFEPCPIYGFLAGTVFCEKKLSHGFLSCYDRLTGRGFCRRSMMVKTK